METWMNWAIFLVIAGAIGFYYTQQNQGPNRGRPITRAAKDGSLEWLDSASKSKPAKQAQAKTKAARKSVKNAVEEVGKKVNATVAAASSTAGVDGDDDMSPVTSPAFRPLATNKAPSGKDVSDMLGAQSAAPSVMSIKSSEKPARPSKPQALKAEAPQESKKARQNRKKAEEAKAAREVEEKHRQALQENQRRTAREARGEPAKNGMASAQAPSSNAWTTVGARGAVQAPVAAPAGQLLDTFEAAPAAAPTNGTRTAPSNNAQPKVALSEDEQVKMAVADSTEWETVPKGKKQKKKVDSDTEAGAPQVARPVKPVQIDKPVRPAVSENKRPSSRYQILTQDFVAGQDDPNDWPVV